MPDLFTLYLPYNVSVFFCILKQKRKYFTVNSPCQGMPLSEGPKVSCLSWVENPGNRDNLKKMSKKKHWFLKNLSSTEYLYSLASCHFPTLSHSPYHRNTLGHLSRHSDLPFSGNYLPFL